MERCVIEPSPDGWRLAGTVLLVSDDLPTEIRYTVITDHEWRTRTVGARVHRLDSDRRLALGSDGAGSWHSNDRPIIDLYGAEDVDLGWTPATNSLPIRRLGLAVGESRRVTAAWIGYPDTSVVRLDQEYERLDEHTYRYGAGELSVDLTVDAMGRVTRYPGVWEAIAETADR